MFDWLKRNWHHLLFFATLAGALVLAYVLVGVGLDPAWQTELTNFPDAIGALIGPFFGLVALMLGALYNAKITRDRDDRLQEREVRALAAALAEEMNSTCDALSLLMVQFDEFRLGDPTRANDLWSPDFPVFKGNIGRIGRLGAALDDKVVNIVFTITQTIQFATKTISNTDFDRDKINERIASIEAVYGATFKLMQELYDRAGIDVGESPAIELEPLRSPSPRHPRSVR